MDSSTSWTSPVSGLPWWCNRTNQGQRLEKVLRFGIETGSGRLCVRTVGFHPRLAARSVGLGIVGFRIDRDRRSVSPAAWSPHGSCGSATLAAAPASDSYCLRGTARCRPSLETSAPHCAAGGEETVGVGARAPTPDPVRKAWTYCKEKARRAQRTSAVASAAV